ncbi:hypothetical protein GGI20_002620 [Coemansia sp. BCRC 34301]|nr:hypothetical protein GGI20_002620 [Coemansia sp. BCRC 34301]
MARQLTIAMLYDKTFNHLRHIALKILELERIDWMHINTLTVVGIWLECEHYGEQTASDDSIQADVACTVEYFGQNMRNIVELNLPVSYLGGTGDHIRDSFASMYSDQLQILRAKGSIPLTISNFTRNLVVLELRLDSEAARALPGVCGETLRVLKLDDVPHNFAWHHFRYNIFVGPIVFLRLATLHLSYRDEDTRPTEDNVQKMVALGALNCNQLHFPVLKELLVQNCTPDCDLLYADNGFPDLAKVHLFGLADTIRHCSRLKLGWVGDLVVKIDTRWVDPTQDIHEITNRLLGNICIGRTAALDIGYYWPALDPELVRWAGLTHLKLDTVAYKTFCRLVARLPNLVDFRTSCLELGGTLTNGFAVDESLFLCSDPMLAWGERLAVIGVLRLGNDCSVDAGAYAIQAIIAHAAGLRKLTVPSYLDPLLAVFIGRKKNGFPHFANVEIYSD